MGSPPSFYEHVRSGVPAPQVDPNDLKSLWEFVSTVQNSNSSGPNETGRRRGVCFGKLLTCWRDIAAPVPTSPP
jgi:hypothetical protein